MSNGARLHGEATLVTGTARSQQAAALVLALPQPPMLQPAAAVSALIVAKRWDELTGALTDSVAQSPALRQTDGELGTLPLHLAAKHQAPISVIEQLMELWPDAIKEVSTSGNYPWELAASAVEPCVAVVERLLAGHLQAVGEIGSGASERLKVHDEISEPLVPIHLACKYGAPAALLAQLLQRRPQACSERRDGHLPLHWAAAKQAPLAIVEQMLAAYPDALSQTDPNLCLPLHLAAAGHAPLEVLWTLLSAYPDAVRKEDGRGDVPLHLAARFPDQCSCGYAAGFRVRRCKCEAGATSILVDAYPQALAEARGWRRELPLHLALENGASPAIIRRLIEGYPEAIVTRRGHGGVLPLHIAASCGTSLEVVNWLLEACPASIQSRSAEGELALHLALANKAPPEVVTALREAHPESIRAHEGNTKLLSSLMAKTGSETVAMAEVGTTEHAAAKARGPVPQPRDIVGVALSGAEWIVSPDDVDDLGVAEQGRGCLAPAASGLGVLDTLADRRDREDRRREALRARNARIKNI